MSLRTSSLPTPRPCAAGRIPFNRFLVGAVLILLGAFALRVWELGQPSLWADEIMTEYRAQAPLGDTLKNILLTIDQTPIFFLTMRLFPTGSEFLLRFPVVLGGVLGVALVMVVARRLFHSDMAALWVGVWLAVNPYHVWLSRTARHYSLIFILSLLIAYSFLLLWHSPPTRRRWAAFILVSLLGYLTHYSLLALPFSQMLLMLLHWRERRPFVWQWARAQAVAAIPVAVWAGLMVLHMPSREPQWGERPWLGDLVLTLRNMTVGIDGPFMAYALPGLLVAAGAGLMVAWSWRSRSVEQRETLRLLSLLALVPILLVFVLAVVAVNAYIDRYFMALLPAMTLLIGYAWAVVARAIRQGAMIAALIAVLITGLFTVGRSLHEGTLQREDWRGAAAYIAQHFRPDDVFVVDRAVTMTSLRRYLDAAEPLRVIQLSETDEPIPADEPGTRYWVIYRAPDEDIHRVGTLPAFDPLKAQPSVVSDWLLPRSTHTVEVQAFDGVTILLLNLDQSTTQHSAHLWVHSLGGHASAQGH